MTFGTFLRRALCTISTAAAMLTPHPAAAGHAIGYFSSWSIYGRDYHVADLPAEQITHINYAFVGVSPSGQCELTDPWADIQKPYPGDGEGAVRGNFRQLEILKAAHPHLKTLLSIGGWTLSGRFSDVALTPTSRQVFAASCVAMMDQYGFDGLDIDWEFPVSGGLPGNTTRPEDKQNYTLLMAELRSRLTAQGVIDGRTYLLTAALPASPGVLANFELDLVHPHVDWLAIMAYDMQGEWSAVTSFHNALYSPTDDPPSESNALSGDAAVQAFEAAGVPAAKIALGVPFYGRGWKNVSATNNGLFQSHGGPPVGTTEGGLIEYRDLADDYLPTYTRYFHAGSRVPWLYNPSTQIMVSYEDPESLAEKSSYATAQGLAGVMVWDLSLDDDLGTLINALGGAPASNCPTSPPSGCDTPGKSSISLRTSGTPKLSWNFSRGQVARVIGDFGDPVATTTYSLCLYDASGLLASADVPSGLAWSARGSVLRYRADGVIDSVQLRAGDADNTSVKVKTKGTLPAIATPMVEPLAVTVTLVHDAGSVCFADTYDSARTNEAGSFSARNPD